MLQLERNAVLTGFQRWREVTLGGLAVGAASTVVVIAVLALGGGISGIFAVEAAAGACSCSSYDVSSSGAPSGRLPQGGTKGAPMRRMLRYTGIASIGVVLTVVVWRRSEFLFLNYYSTNAEIGFYSIAFAAAAAVLLLPLADHGRAPAVDRHAARRRRADEDPLGLSRVPHGCCSCSRCRSSPQAWRSARC